jgi:hypothetical protein
VLETEPEVVLCTAPMPQVARSMSKELVVLLSMALLWRCASRMPPPAPPAALGLLAKGSCLELAFAEPIVAVGIMGVAPKLLLSGEDS